MNNNKSVLIQLSGDDLETLIFDCVDRAIKLNHSTISTAYSNDAEPFGNFSWLQGVCAGIPASTLRIKSASGEIPGVVKFGKRVLFDKVIVLNFLRSQARQTAPETAEVERAAEQQVTAQLTKRSARRTRKTGAAI